MIRINEDYVITGDSKDFTLCKDLHSVDKDNNPRYGFIAYCNSVEHALVILNRYQQRMTVSKKDMSLQEAAKEFERIAEDLKQYYKRFA